MKALTLWETQAQESEGRGSETRKGVGEGEAMHHCAGPCVPVDAKDTQLVCSDHF